MFYDSHNARRLRGIPLSTTAPMDGQGLVYDASGNVWKPGSVGGSLADGSVTTAKLAAAAVTSAKLDPSTIQYATVALTSAQIKALSGTPVTLLAAQGAGTLIEFVSGIVNLVYGTSAYVNGAGGGPAYRLYLGTDKSTAPASVWADGNSGMANILKFAGNCLGVMMPQSESGGGSGTVITSGAGFNALNLPLILQNSQGSTFDLVTGDGTAVFQIAYRVHSGLSS